MPAAYVDSNATTGNNTGGSWENAYLSLASAVGVAAGSEIWIASDHVEGASGNITYNFSNGTRSAPIRVISVNSGTNAYEAGAKLNTSGNSTQTVNSSVTLFGIHFYAQYYTVFSTGGGRQVCVNCKFEMVTSGNGYSPIHNIGQQDYNAQDMLLYDCEIIAPATGNGSVIGGPRGSSILHVRNLTVTGCDQKTVFVDRPYSTSYPNRATIIIEDCDLSTWSDIVDPQSADVIIRRCKLKSGFGVFNDYHAMNNLIIENCDDGSITVPPIGLTWHQTEFGDVKGVSSVYRSTGASDGETSYSWEMVSQSTCIEATYNAISTPDITRWVTGGSEIDITVYVASGGTLNNDDVWIEISGPDNTASPNQSALGYTYSSRAAILATPAALTTDSNSTWNGTGVGTKQKITHSYTPTESGPITVKVYLAKPSTTVYVDPKIEIS